MFTLLGFPDSGRSGTQQGPERLHTVALFFVTVLLTFSATLSAGTERTLMVLGDSLSSAYNVPVEEAWVSLLEQRLEQKGMDWTVANESISGETTGGGLRRLPELLQDIEPEAIVIELGGNDGLRGFPPKVIRDNLAQMVELSQDSGARVLLVGMQMPPNYGGAYTAAFSAVYSDIAERYGIPLVPFFLEGVYDRPGAMQPDGIHPTVSAQSRLLENIWPKLQTILEETAAAN